ncbi:hypothetical protein [Haloplanus salinarum]|uniref:hypothetical protein n=1 Tax=Haloplanus salinarum TaxID=1912324 RepID=UPI00214CCF84|nr:hypothetical protein [Haloplanus salinarum]
MTTFYHVDLLGELEVGDVLDLYWPPQVYPGEFALPPDDSMSPEGELEALRSEFPEGLSSHGARHALSALVGINDPPIEGGVQLPLEGKYQGMVALLFRAQSEDGEYERRHYDPAPVLLETGLELLRQSDFESEQSRFQSYFGAKTQAEANHYRQRYRGGNGQLVAVECESYDVRDMDLVEASSFIEILRDGRRYWEGEAGSENPTWEVLMEPPIEIVEIVDGN